MDLNSTNTFLYRNRVNEMENGIVCEYILMFSSFTAHRTYERFVAVRQIGMPLSHDDGKSKQSVAIWYEEIEGDSSGIFLRMRESYEYCIKSYIIIIEMGGWIRVPTNAHGQVYRFPMNWSIKFIRIDIDVYAVHCIVVDCCCRCKSLFALFTWECSILFLILFDCIFSQQSITFTKCFALQHKFHNSVAHRPPVSSHRLRLYNSLRHGIWWMTDSMECEIH